jgi:hypothetical protein
MSERWEAVNRVNREAVSPPRRRRRRMCARHSHMMSSDVRLVVRACALSVERVAVWMPWQWQWHSALTPNVPLVGSERGLGGGSMDLSTGYKPHATSRYAPQGEGAARTAQGRGLGPVAAAPSVRGSGSSGSPQNTEPGLGLGLRTQVFLFVFAFYSLSRAPAPAPEPPTSICYRYAHWRHPTPHTRFVYIYICYMCYISTPPYVLCPVPWQPW